MKNYNIKEMKEYLRSVVNDKRYHHSLLVADEALKLALQYGIDKDKVYITALNHDIAKNFNDEENKRLVEKYNLDRKLLDYNYKNVLHADIGAIFVKEKYDFDDDMCKAIKYHAIGNPNMDLLAKIIFIADKTGRENLNSDYQEIKNISYKDIDKAIILYIDILRKSLKERNLEEQKDTLELYEILTKNNNTN